MQTARWSIHILADRKTVWDTMLGDATYRLWTRPFVDGSYYVGSWEAGSEIRFLVTLADGTTEGMYSRIKENIPYKRICIEHLGVITKGRIDTSSEEVKSWSPALEEYTFTDVAGGTQVTVDMQVEDKHRQMFDEQWPRALRVLKALCERKE